MELVLGALDLLVHRLALPDQGQRQLIVAALDAAPDVLAQLRDLGAPLGEIRLDLVAHVEDAGHGLLQLVVLARAFLDGLLVDGLRVLPLLVAHPDTEGAAQEGLQSGEESSGSFVMGHGRCLLG